MKHLNKSSKINSFIFAYFLLLFLDKGNVVFGQAANTWTQKASVGSGRYGVTGFSIGTKGYFACGNSGSAVPDLWEYDPSTNVWTQKANYAGGGRTYPTSFSIGTKGYVGTGQNGGTYYNDFYEYDPSTNIWTAKASVPGVRYVAAGFSVGSKGYIGTGSNGAFLNDFYEYDPSLNTWTSKATYPGGTRYGASGFSVGTKGYIVGGNTGTVMGDCYEYDPSTNSWTAKASLPVAKWIAAAFSVGSKGYFGCGNNATTVQNDFYEYDPGLNTWTSKATVGGGTRGYGPACFGIGTKGYIGCGYGGTYANDFWEYSAVAPGAALNFDGSNDRVSVPANTTLDFGTGDFTVESYFKSSVSQPNYAGIVVKASSSSVIGFQMVLYTNKLAAEFGSSSAMLGVGNGLIGTTTITDGNWHHVAMVVTRSQNKIELLVDGVIEASVVNANVSTINVNTAAPLLIGTERTLVAYANANIDEVRLWNVARTQCQINTYKNCEIATTATGLVGNYHFNQGYDASSNPTETTLTDVSGNTNTGTLTNFALTGSTSNWIAPGGVITGSTTPASLPAVTATPSSTTICNSQSAILTGGGASTYTWSGGITNATAFSPTTSASYTVTGTNTLTGCTNTAVAAVTVNNCNPAAALNFDGTNDDVRATGFPVFTEYTIEGWFKLNSLADQNLIVGTDASGPNSSFSNQIRLSGGKFVHYLWDGSVQTVSSSIVPATGVWNHVAIVAKNGTPVRIYVNGVQDVSVSNTGTMQYVDQYRLAGTASGVFASFNGQMDEVRIWNVARTQCEINTYKNCEIPTTATGLLANYHFNQGFDAVTNTITTLTNASSASYNGTLYNFALTGSTSNWIAPGAVITGSTTPAALTPTVTASATNSVICNGASTTLNGGGASTYVWTGGVTNGIAFSPTSTQSYTVTGTSTTGCTNTAVQGVTVNPLPVVTASVSNAVICEGSMTTLNGVGADTYTWTGGVSDGVAFTPLASGSYTVTGTNTLTGCSNTAVGSVTVNTLPVVTASITNSVICDGSSTTVMGGGADTYTWTGGVMDGVAFTPSVSGSYTVTGTNTLTGCTSTNIAVANLTVNPTPTVTAAGGAICSGGSFTINPNGANTYTISGGSNVVSPSSTASYTITGTSVDGCVGAPAVITVSVQSSLTVSISGPTAVCDGQAVSLTANGAATYSWNTGATSNTIAPTPTTTTTYSVVGTSGSCSDSTMVMITVNSNPTVTTVSSASLICAGQTVSLTASGAVTYTWSTSSTGSTIVDTPTTTVTYTVTGEDANGCMDTDTIQQSVSPCTGIEFLNSEIAIKVYPNPGNGLVTLELYYDAQVIVMNVIGGVISNERLSEGKHELDIQKFASGVYFVKVIHNGNQQIIKLIKE